jgi:uncharacterized protein (TIGR02246 family)
VNPKTPAEVVERFSERLTAGDLDGALQLYEPEAAFVAAPGETVQGHAAIAEALRRLLALEPRLEGQVRKVVESGDTALVINDWRLVGRDPSGDPVEMSGCSADVVRRRADGGWRVLIDDPWGGARADRHAAS